MVLSDGPISQLLGLQVKNTFRGRLALVLLVALLVPISVAVAHHLLTDAPPCNPIICSEWYFFDDLVDWVYSASVVTLLISAAYCLWVLGREFYKWLRYGTTS